MGSRASSARWAARGRRHERASSGRWRGVAVGRHAAGEQGPARPGAAVGGRAVDSWGLVVHTSGGGRPSYGVGGDGGRGSAGYRAEGEADGNADPCGGGASRRGWMRGGSGSRRMGAAERGVWKWQLEKDSPPFASAFLRRRDGGRDGREVTGWRMDAAVAVDAKNAPTAPWTRRRRRAHSAHEPFRHRTRQGVANVDRERVLRVHAVTFPARCGSKQVPSRSMAQATLSRRSTTERRERACPWPRLRSA